MTLEYDIELLDVLCEKISKTAMAIRFSENKPRGMKSVIDGLMSQVAATREAVKYWKDSAKKPLAKQKPLWYNMQHT